MIVKDELWVNLTKMEIGTLNFALELLSKYPKDLVIKELTRYKEEVENELQETEKEHESN